MAFGLTSTGLNIKQQSDIISEIQSALQSAFGANINLLPQSVFGQLVGILSEREALIWQLVEAVYSSQYPAGAEGTSVDNILALNNLRRLPASPTKTAPTNTAGVPGFVLYGTPGTIIPAGSIISVQGNLTVQFTLDATVTILAAVNAVQAITLYGGTPTTGTFSLGIIDQFNHTTGWSPVTVGTQPIPWNAPTNTTLISWSGTAPTTGQYGLGLNGVFTPLIDVTISNNASDLQAAITSLSGYSGVTVTGTAATAFTIHWGAISNPVVSSYMTRLYFNADPTSGVFQISLNGTPITSVPYTATAAQLQAAINALPGYESVKVSGFPTHAVGLWIIWGWVTPATVLVTVQPGGTTINVFVEDTLNQPTSVLNSIQSYINTLVDGISNVYPYTDVALTGDLSSSLVTAFFGQNTPLAGQPSSGGRTQNLFTVLTDSLQNGTTVINVAAKTTVIGAPAEGVGAATCTVNGPNFVSAGFLTVIGSPVSGWASVNNPLDCITGSNLESDTAALARRSTLLAAQANGPLQAIVEKVAQVTGVIQALGFENLSLAADQIVTFAGATIPPTAGYFILIFTGPGATLLLTGHISYAAFANTQVLKFSSVPASGHYNLVFGVSTTANIAFNAPAATIQAAVQALTVAGVSYAGVIVSGNYTDGFNFAFGILPQTQMSATNSLGGGVTITTIPSVQSVINDVAPYNAARVTGSYSTGFTIGFFGSAGGQPQVLATPQNFLTGVSTITVGFGRPGKSFEIVVNDNNGEASNTAIAQAILNSKPAGIETFGTTSQQVSDAFGNPYSIYFSRPTQVPIYITLSLQTDLTTSQNPKFNPSSIATIQQDLVTIGNAFPIGGLIVGFGSNGLIGAFNAVPGIQFYTFFFGTSPSPSSNANIQLQAEQVALFESFNIIVSFV